MIVKRYIHPAFYSGEDDSDIDLDGMQVQIKLKNGTLLNLTEDGEGLTIFSHATREDYRIL